MQPTKQMLREENRDRFNRWKKSRKKARAAKDHMNRERFDNKFDRNNRFFELRADGKRGVSRYCEIEKGVTVYFVAWSR